MNILLINPSQSHALQSEAGDLPEESTGKYPPLGLLYLQAAVEADGRHRAEVLDANLPGELERRLRGGGPRPDLVGVTALTPNLVGVMRTVAAARQAYPQAKVVLGGPHVDIFPRQTVALEGVDFALCGEAEETFPRLVDSIEQGGLDPALPGLHTREIRCDGKPRVEDLDSLPLPDRSRLDAHAYRGVAGDALVFATMSTSRGCPFRCAFCSTPEGKYRMRGVDSIVEEMQRISRLGVQHIYFLDDTFPVRGKRLRALCEALLRQPGLPSWSCRTATAGLTRENLSLMKRAGCDRIQIGVETHTEEGLKVLRKSTSIQQIRQTFAGARQARLPTMAYFMLGLPNEQTPEQVRVLFRFARQIDPTYAMFNVLTLYPGTALFAQAVERGLVEADAWERFASCPDPDFVQPVWDEYISREVLFALQDEAYRSFYLRPRTVLRLALSGGLRQKARAGLQMLLANRLGRNQPGPGQAGCAPSARGVVNRPPLPNPPPFRGEGSMLPAFLRGFLDRTDKNIVDKGPKRGR